MDLVSGLVGLTLVGIVFGGVTLGIIVFWSSDFSCDEEGLWGSVFWMVFDSGLELVECGLRFCLSWVFSRTGLASAGTVLLPVFLLAEWLNVGSEDKFARGPKVSMDRITTMSAPAIVQDTYWRSPSRVRSMQVRFPSSTSGLEAKG